MQSEVERNRVSAVVAHSVFNKLSIIIGNCDLLMARAQSDSVVAQRLAIIREAARTAADELTVQLQRAVKSQRRKAS